MKRLPVIAIVGRPNVGKSSLLNALAGKLISIVQDMPGVTRDRISFPIPIIREGETTKFVELVDTGGYGFDDSTGLTNHIRQQIELAMARADLVLFIVDAKEGLTAADLEVAALLRSKGLKVGLIANKADSEKNDAEWAEMSRLGFGNPVGVSAMNGRNVDAIFELIAQRIDLTNAPESVPPPEMLVAIVGKRNAGKSTLVNSISRVYEQGDDRVIVSEVPGTTRDSVDVRFEKEGKVLVVIDTAGVRKKRHMVTNDIEFYSFHRAERSIRRADVVLMLLDATEPISEPDKKLAGYIAEQMKPVVIVVNKWDLARVTLKAEAEKAKKKFMDSDAMEEYRSYIDQEFRSLDYAPIAFITAKDDRNIQGVVDLAQHLFRQASERVGTGRLNSAVKRVFEERFPSTPNGRRARVYYATQTGTNPPTIVLFVNNPAFLNDSYQRFMINRFRELLPYPEVPIRLQLKGKDTQTAEREAKGKKVPILDAPTGPKPKLKTKSAPKRAPVRYDRKLSSSKRLKRSR